MTKPLELDVATCRVLTLSDGKAPEWIHLLPVGPEVEGRDGRRFVIDDAQAVVNAFDGPLIVDEDHESEMWSGSTEASGWVEELRLVTMSDSQFDRPGIWGRVDWTPEGAACVQGKSYRYLSPAFYRWIDDAGVSHVVKMSSVALTNRPNLDLKSLNRAGAEAPKAPAAEVTKPMNAEQLAALKAACGLGADASNDVLFVALNSKATQAPAAPALNADTVPRADLEVALNRAKAAEEALATHAKASHEVAVNAAIEGAKKDGKIAPASEAHYRALCATPDGLKMATELFASLPSLVALASVPLTPIADAQNASLNAAEKRVAKSLGLTDAQALANKAKTNGGAV